LNPAATQVTKDFLRHVQVVALITICGLLLFFGSLQSPFLYDDAHSIVDNPHTQSLEPFKHKLTFGDLLNRNVLLFTFALNRVIGGEQVLGYHLVNVLIHILVALLVYLIARELSLSHVSSRKYSQALPLLAAMLMLFHPMSVESVAYLSSRSSLLATLFFLLGFYFFLRWQKFNNQSEAGIKNNFRLMWVLIFFILGIGSKEIAVTLPLMILAALWVWNPKRNFRQWLKTSALILLPLAMYIAYRTYTLGGLFRLNAAPTAGINEQVFYFLTQFKVLLTYYLTKIFLPFNLNFEPDVRLIENIADPVWMLALSGLVLLGVLVARRGSSWMQFGFLWALLTILPTSSLIPLKQIAVEHRTYLPGVGLSLVFAAMFSWALAKHRNFIFPVSILLILFSILTLNRGLDFRSRIDIWKDTIKKSPAKALVHNNLASAYLDAKRHDEARTHLVKVLKLNPNHIEGHLNLGHILVAEENWAAAQQYFDNALALGTEKPVAYFNAGLCRLLQGAPRQAIAFMQKAVDLKPQDASFHFHLGNAYKDLGQSDKALHAFRQTLKIEPDHLQAHNNSGVIYWNLKMFDFAETEFKSGLKEDANHPEIHNNLASLYLVTTRYPEAIRHLKRLVELQPENQKARQLLKFAHLKAQETTP
jgi:tetratricopeptide (TPR) repeat protein